MSDVEVNKYGTGEPLPQDYVIKRMKAREAKLNSEAKHFQESLNRSYTEGEKFMSTFIDALKKSGIDFEKTISTVEQRKEELIKSKQYPK